jgi:hypothetical protein
VEIILFNPLFFQLVTIDLANVIIMWKVTARSNAFRFPPRYSGFITVAVLDSHWGRLVIRPFAKDFFVVSQLAISELRDFSSDFFFRKV